MKFFKLNNGIEMPAIGLGTYPMNKIKLIITLYKASKIGYSSFDTAQAYGNEKYVGYGMKLSPLDRKNFFITTKLSNYHQRSGNIRAAFFESMAALKTDYIDLYLMHWPNPETFLYSWKQMEEVYKEGYCKAIGLCNFHEHHIDKLMKVASITPAVNQFETHPLLTQESLINYCKSLGIQVVAYSPLARMDEKLVNEEYLKLLSLKYKKTLVQIVLRWNYQRGVISIPKTQNKKRLLENIDIFDFNLTNEEIKKISLLNINYRIRHNPDNCDFSKL
jgi:diketogulonate reductase-like aldo/keto reductase